MRSRRRTVDSSVNCTSPGVDKMIQTISEAEGRLKQALHCKNEFVESTNFVNITNCHFNNSYVIVAINCWYNI